MRRFEDLIRYNLQSAAELAKEESLTTLEFLAKMALLENAAPTTGGLNTMPKLRVRKVEVHRPAVAQ